MKKAYADYLLKLSKDSYNKMAVEFSRTRHGFWSDLNPLLEYVRPGLNILDVGCGNGRLFNILSKSDIIYTGIDNSLGLIDEAKRLNPNNSHMFSVADALNLPFQNSKFDLIYSIAVMQHIPGKEYRLKFLSECKRVLKDNGKVVITNWLMKEASQYYKSTHNFWNNLKVFFHLTSFDFNDLFVPFKSSDGKEITKRYIHAFSSKELRKLVLQSGLKIEKSGYTVDKNGKRRNLYIVATKY